jgi:hypothetical protein
MRLSGSLLKKRQWRMGWSPRIFELTPTKWTYAYPRDNLTREYSLTSSCSVKAGVLGGKHEFTVCVKDAHGKAERMVLRPLDNNKEEMDNW